MCQVDLDRYLAYNKKWSDDLQIEITGYFDHLKEGQHPVALLIGCSDSRVSPSEVGLGELFVHRNIANVVAHNDLNFLSVMQYAVEHLGIRDIVVYGHYGCGGIQAAYDNQSNGLIDNWLATIKDVIRHHDKELAAIPEREQRLDRLVELNVLEQIENIKQTSVYKKAWDQGIVLHLHAWVFDISTGKVYPLDIPSPVGKE